MFIDIVYLRVLDVAEDWNKSWEVPYKVVFHTDARMVTPRPTYNVCFIAPISILGKPLSLGGGTFLYEELAKISILSFRKYEVYAFMKKLIENFKATTIEFDFNSDLGVISEGVDWIDEEEITLAVHRIKLLKSVDDLGLERFKKVCIERKDGSSLCGFVWNWYETSDGDVWLYLYLDRINYIMPYVRRVYDITETMKKVYVIDVDVEGHPVLEGDLFVD